MPVIQARPVTVGTTAGTNPVSALPTSVVPTKRPVNVLPMKDSLTKSWCSGS